MGWLSWPSLTFPPINLYSLGMAGSHLTDDEWLRQRKHELSEDEIDEFEEEVDVTTTRLGLETARRVALERVLRMRMRG
jgi:hypothetical protein